MNRIQDTAGTGYHPVRQRSRARRPAGTSRRRGLTRSLAVVGDSGSGGKVAIRQARPADRDAIREFLTGLSPRTSYLRFFTGAPAMGSAMLRLLAGESDDADVLVATEADVIVGHAMAVDSTVPSGFRMTEIGVAVTDQCQGRGIGSALTRELTARAGTRGTGTVVMDVLAENRRVLAMIARRWPGAHYDRSGPCFTVHARLVPGAGPAPAADGRLL